MRTTVSVSVVLVALALGAVPAWAQEGPGELGGPLETADHALEFDAAGGGGGGGGGATSAANARTRTFSSAAYVDYNSRGGEPSNAVDRYPFPGVTEGLSPLDLPSRACPAGQTTCFKDLVYVSAPQGLPGFSFIWKSDDLGGTFRLPSHVPATGFVVPFQGPGGGDSYQAVGELTHNVFFLDLPGDCVTFNRSTDLGEHWSSDELGCGFDEGAIDDRQWVDTDESAPGGQSVYISFIHADAPVNATARTLVMVRSQDDGATIGSFALDSPCSIATQEPPSTAAADDAPTDCPDPTDPGLRVAGPIIADKPGDHAGSHQLYIPFLRRVGNDNVLYIARSTPGGDKWVRRPVANVGVHNPRNIFPQLAIDRGGNLYYTWSQTIDGADGETDVFYAYSTDQGEHWSAPIDLTKENGDSAVFPWMVAGDPGRVDLVFYKANTGINPNVAFVDAQGTQPNPSVWNVYFAQSLNALNPGANFRTVQISDRPNHLGQICTLGTGCSGNRNLLDFFTVDVDHLGAANVTWADDNNNLEFTRNLAARQLSSTGVYKNVQIGLQNDWPTKDHSATDRAGDVRDALGEANDSCTGMDVLGTSADRSGDRLTVSLTLNAPPTAAAATTCGRAGGIGGLWGAEFWAARAPDPADDAAFPNANFYIAYADNPPEGPHVEAGRVDNFNATLQSFEFDRKQDGTFGGTCFAPAPPAPCTVTMTTTLSTLGIKPGAGLFSVTGLSTYIAGRTERPPFLRVSPANTELGDAVTPFDASGTGQTP